MAAILSCLCWDSQAHGDSGEGDGCDLAFHWRDCTRAFGRRVLHGCSAHMLLEGNSEPVLEWDCRGGQVLSWAITCLIGEILVWNRPGTGLLEGLVSFKVLLPETWLCNYWLVKESNQHSCGLQRLIGKTKFCICDRALSWCREHAPVRWYPKQSLSLRCPEADFATRSFCSCWLQRPSRYLVGGSSPVLGRLWLQALWSVQGEASGCSPMAAGDT